MKKIFSMIILFLVIFSVDVYANNNVEYTLTITDDYEFKESIRYSIDDYKQEDEGYNYFYDIVNDDVYTDIFYKTKYKKVKKKNNNTYNITLSHTYNEYTFSNSNFLNNCFEGEVFTYDIDNYSLKNEKGFSCLYGNSLKITIITDFEVVSTDAIVSGNKYTWIPTAGNHSMNMVIKKTYKEVDDISGGHGINEGEEFENIPKGVDDILPEDAEEIVNDNESNSISGIVIAVIFVILSIIGIIVVIVLKAKKSNLNKI